jgi:hypothetical protein
MFAQAGAEAVECFQAFGNGPQEDTRHEIQHRPVTLNELVQPLG